MRMLSAWIYPHIINFKNWHNCWWIFLISYLTEWPSPISLSTRWDPMKPAPPVTRTLNFICNYWKWTIRKSWMWLVSSKIKVFSHSMVMASHRNSTLSHCMPDINWIHPDLFFCTELICKESNTRNFCGFPDSHIASPPWHTSIIYVGRATVLVFCSRPWHQVQHCYPYC